MGLFGGSKTKKTTKPTLMTKIGGASLIGAFLPWGSGTLEGEDIAKQFPGGLPPGGSTSEIGGDSTFAPYRRYVENYNPYSYPGSRPGGMNEAETGLLNNSLYGRQAPLDMSGMQGAANRYSEYINGLLGHGGANDWSGAHSGSYGASGYGGYYGPGTDGATGPGMGEGAGMSRASYSPYPSNWIAGNQPGRSWNEKTGQWEEVSSGADITWDADTNTTYYRGIPLSSAEVQAGIRGGMKGLQDAMQARSGSSLIENIGKQAQNALGFGSSYYDRPPERPILPDAPQLDVPNFDAASYAKRMLDTIGGNGELDKYVTGATEGMRKEYEHTLAQQQADLESKYNYEGGYLSSPMFAAKGQLSGELTSNYLKDMGLMQLDAANKERDRMYGLAGQGIGTQGNYLSNTFGSKAGALANMYGSNLGAISDMYGTEAGLFGKLMGDTSSARASIINNAMQLMEKGYANSFDQAEKMATALQQNQQGGLDKLHEDYYKPGENMLQILSLLMGLPYKTKETTKDGGGLAGIGSALTGAADFGALLA